MCLSKNYTPLAGFILPENSYYSIPDCYQNLPIKKRSIEITNWEWVKQTHGENVKTLLQDGRDCLAPVIGGIPIGMHISKVGDYWPDGGYVSISDIEVKRVHYYRVIHKLNDQMESYAALIIDEVDDVAIYSGADLYINQDGPMNNLQMTLNSNGPGPITTNIKLNYLSEKEAHRVISLFDNEISLIEAMAALKKITKGFHKVILDQGEAADPKIKKMFSVVNKLQGALYQDRDYSKLTGLMREAGL